MKNTEKLNVRTNFHLQNDVLIHPNEGFEMGLMNTAMAVKIFANVVIEVFNAGDKEFLEGQLILSNDCTPGEIILSHKYWKKIGSPEKVTLFYDDCKILIANS